MKPNHDVDAALRAISKARAQLILGNPFFAALALRLQVVPTQAVATAGVDGRHLFINPAFVNAKKPAHLLTVVAHEALHVALHHATRLKGRDHARANIACLSEETVVRMSDGKLVPISLIKVGDSVWSPFGPSRVLANIYRGILPTIRLEIFGSQPIFATPDHRFLSEKGWFDVEVFSRGGNLDVFRETGGSGVLPGELQNPLPERPERGYGREIYARPRSAEATWIGREPLYAEESEYQGRVAHERDGQSLFSWSDRRGRDDIDLPDAKDIFSPFNMHIQHLDDLKRLPTASWISGDICAQERGWPALLENALGWVSGGGVFSPDTAILGNQSEAQRLANRVHFDTKEHVERSAADGSYAGYCLRNSLAERTRVAASGAGEARPVYDLVTEHHVFSAGSLITHNCDFAINLILEEAKFAMPPDALLDKKYAGMAWEQIYPLIPEQPRMRLVMIMPGGGDGDPATGNGQPLPDFGGMGCVIEPTDGAGKPLSEAEVDALERDWKVAVLQAAQQAKAKGMLPASLSALAESIRAPQIDWRAALRDFVRQTSRNDYSWRGPCARMLASGDYLPSLYDETTGPILMGVDTSGSVSQAELNAVCAELNGCLDTARPESVFVVYCDAKAHGHEEFRPDDWPVKMRVQGRGGTHLAPIWPYAEKHEVRPVCAIVTTDMELCVADLGPEPSYPVLFLSTGRDHPHDGPLPYGTLVKVDAAQDG